MAIKSLDKLFSVRQLKMLAFGESDYDALIAYGSVRSGKSSVMSLAFVLWAMKHFNNCLFAICGKTVQTALKNVVKPLLTLSYLNERYKLSLRISNGELVITDGVVTNTFYIYGGKDESSYQLIQGITLAGVFFDEVALMPRSFVEQALARCSVDGSKFWFNCNPEGQMHWFYQEWILKAKEHNALVLHFTMADNPSLSDKVRARYESMYTGLFHDRYIKGLWVSADGVIYKCFSKDKHVIRYEDVPELEGNYFVSADYGIQNPTIFLLWRKVKDKDIWVCLNEWSYSGREAQKDKTVAELADGFESLLPDDTKPKYAVIDPSASALIVELQRRGYKTVKAINDVVEGIEDVTTMLDKSQLLFTDRCKNTIREFGLYVWDEKAANRGEDKPIKENDHGMDAVRYHVHTNHLVKRIYKKERRNTSAAQYL